MQFPSYIPATCDGVAAKIRKASTPGYFNVWAISADDAPYLQTSRGRIEKPLARMLTAREAAAYATYPEGRAAILGTPDSSD